MNITYIMKYWPVYGGGETITVTLANEFVRRGHSVHILYQTYNTCSPMPYTLDERIICTRMRTDDKFSDNDVQILHKYLVEHDINVMINQWGSTELCNKARRFTNCKFIICWHLDILQPAICPQSTAGRLVTKIFGDYIYKLYMRHKQIKNHDRNYMLSDRYIFLSKSFADEYKRITNIEVNEEKIGAVSNPLTYNLSYDMRDYDKKKKQVLFVGRIYEYHKRLSYILSIWKEIEKDARLNEWNLAIVGDGPDMKSTQTLCKSLGLERVSFEGFKKPTKYYEESSLFMMTSSLEGFGMTLIEAQAYGVVSVAMDSYSSLHDIIESEKNGIIVPNNDIQGFTSVIKNLMTDECYRKKLAEAGIESCKKFSVTSICNQWESIFKDLNR